VMARAATIHHLSDLGKGVNVRWAVVRFRWRDSLSLCFGTGGREGGCGESPTHSLWPVRAFDESK
jgi:hypothetical protein